MEAINLGTDTSLALSKEQGVDLVVKAKPYAISLSKVVAFLERFMVEIVPPEELQEQGETVKVTALSMQQDLMDKPSRSAEQMHSKINAALDSLMDQERASKGRQQLIGASIPTSPRETIVVDGLSQTQAQRSQELFVTCDTDASGAIEVAEILMVFGSNIVLDQLEELVNLEKEGLIDLDYWQRFMVERKRSRGDKKFNHLLNLLENEAKYFHSESRAMLTKSGDDLALTPMQIRRCTLLHEACDKNGDGTVSPSELQKVGRATLLTSPCTCTVLAYCVCTVAYHLLLLLVCLSAVCVWLSIPCPNGYVCRFEGSPRCPEGHVPYRPQQ